MSLSIMNLLPFLSKSIVLKHCDICPYAKQTRLCYPKPTTLRSLCSFELLHMDIWGLFRTPTYNVQRYFLTIVDDYTRGTWVFLMQSKLDILRILTQFFTIISTQFSSKTKSIHTDNALDLFKSECSSLFSAVGIVHQSSLSTLLNKMVLWNVSIDISLTLLVH